MALVITHDKVAISGVVTRDIFVSARLQQHAEFRDIFVLQGDVQVCVRASSFTQERIYAPTTVNNDINILPGKKLHQLDGSICAHFRVGFWLKMFGWFHVYTRNAATTAVRKM